MGVNQFTGHLVDELLAQPAAGLALICPNEIRSRDERASRSAIGQ